MRVCNDIGSPKTRHLYIGLRITAVGLIVLGLALAWFYHATQFLAPTLGAVAWVVMLPRLE